MTDSKLSILPRCHIDDVESVQNTFSRSLAQPANVNIYNMDYKTISQQFNADSYKLRV